MSKYLNIEGIKILKKDIEKIDIQTGVDEEELERKIDIFVYLKKPIKIKTVSVKAQIKN